MAIPAVCFDASGAVLGNGSSKCLCHQSFFFPFFEYLLIKCLLIIMEERRKTNGHRPDWRATFILVFSLSLLQAQVGTALPFEGRSNFFLLSPHPPFTINQGRAEFLMHFLNPLKELYVLFLLLLRRIQTGEFEVNRTIPRHRCLLGRLLGCRHGSDAVGQ